MDIEHQIQAYLNSLEEKKRVEMHSLHEIILKQLPNAQLWFLDGKDEKGKVVTNPNIGYGKQILKYKDGSTKEFYRIGISANTSGISIYIMGIEDKNFLKEKFSENIGKATITGYCIKFKKLADLNFPTLMEVFSL